METHFLGLSSFENVPDYGIQFLVDIDSPALPNENVDTPCKDSEPKHTNPLSSREWEVLRLIRQGDSNQNICEKLFLSLSTVKWHNQNIFEKLQVARRTEAVARALALDLLSS